MDTALKVATMAGGITRDGLLAHYRLAETSGTTGEDASGNNRTLTLAAGTAAPTWANPGLTGDGTDDYASAVLPATTLVAFTLEAVLKTTTTVTDRRFASVGNSGGTTSTATLRTTVTPGQAGGTINNSVGVSVTANHTAIINDGAAHYLALVYDGASVALDVDGVTGTPTAASGNLVINRAGLLALVRATVINFAAGTVLSYALYNRALTSDERASNRGQHRRAGILP